MDSPVPPAGQAPLNGWKEIATYLGRSVRSVQRYERELGLPIHRLKTANGQTVYAFAEEIDAWRKRLDVVLPDDDTPPPMLIGAIGEDAAATASTPAAGTPVGRTRWTMPFTLGLIGVAALVVATIEFAIHGTFAHKTLQPVRFVLAGRTFEARDDRDRVIWSHGFDTEVNGIGKLGGFSPTGFPVDFDGNGKPDVVLPIRFGQRDRPSAETDAIYAFRPDGSVRWVVRPTGTFKCGADMFEAPWGIQAIAVSSERGRQRLWVAYRHLSLWPNFVLEILPDGSQHLVFIHTGWVFSLAEWKTAAGSLLAIGGVSNKFDRPTLSLVSATDTAGIQAPSDNPQFNCDDVPSRRLVREVVFPNSELTAIAGRPRDIAQDVFPVGNDLRVTVGPNPQIYLFGPDLALKSFYFGDSFWVAHRGFETNGQLKHAAAACPERVAPRPIRTWTPAGGWRDSTIVPRPADTR